MAGGHYRVHRHFGLFVFRLCPLFRENRQHRSGAAGQSRKRRTPLPYRADRAGTVSPILGDGRKRRGPGGGKIRHRHRIYRRGAQQHGGAAEPAGKSDRRPRRRDYRAGVERGEVHAGHRQGGAARHPGRDDRHRRAGQPAAGLCRDRQSGRGGAAGPPGGANDRRLGQARRDHRQRSGRQPAAAAGRAEAGCGRASRTRHRCRAQLQHLAYGGDPAGRGNAAAASRDRGHGRHQRDRCPRRAAGGKKPAARASDDYRVR